MKKMINKINRNQLIKIIYLFMVILAITVIKIYAQPSSPGGEVDAPIDGGLSLLIAGGVGYGVKKIREKRRASDKL